MTRFATARDGNDLAVTTAAARLLGRGSEAPDWLEGLGRAGLVARGFTYVLVGWLATLVAFGDRDQQADREGALSALARQPFGRWLLVALVVGLAGYALWRAAEAITGRTSSDDDAGAGKRLLSAAKAGLYVTFAVNAAIVAARGADGGGGGEQERTWTARALDWPLGRPLLVAIGLGVIAYGMAGAWRGISQKFLKKLKRGKLDESEERVVRVLGTAGNIGRGLAFALVGGFLVQAALLHDPERSRGMDGALHELAERPYGPVALTAIAAGLVAYGLFSLAESRWRRVLGS